MKLQTFNKIIAKTDNLINPIKPIVKPHKTPRLSFKERFKDFISLIFKPFRFLDNIPFSIIFVIFVVIMFIAVLVANKIASDHLVNTLVKQYPELTTVPKASNGKPLYTSPLDKMFQEFNARVSAAYFLFFAFILRNFLVTIWRNYNVRKPQIIGKV